MADIILDTNILADVLAQYYEGGVRHGGLFESRGSLNHRIVKELNKIIAWHVFNDNALYPGLVTASSFAFVEIARKFDEISAGRFSLLQFAEFIDQPPDWFFISAVDTNLFLSLGRLPGKVIVNDKLLPIEFADAIHMATAISRDEPYFLAVTDARIKAVVLFGDRTI